jgi:hypothetical protein
VRQRNGRSLIDARQKCTRRARVPPPRLVALLQIPSFWGRGDPLVAVAAIEDVVARDLLGPRHEIAPALRQPVLRVDDRARVELEPQRQQRDRAPVRHRDRSAQLLALHEVAELALDRLLLGERGAEAVDPVHLARDEREQRDEREGGEARPPGPLATHV